VLKLPRLKKDVDNECTIWFHREKCARGRQKRARMEPTVRLELTTC